MSIQIILIIIGLIIIFFLAFKLLKGIIKALITVVVLVIVLLITSGIIIYNDAATLKQGIENEATILIMQEEQIITGFKTTAKVSLTSAINNQFYQTLNDDELKDITQKTESEDLKEIDKDHLIIMIEQKIFYEDELILNQDTIQINEQTLETFATTQDMRLAIELLQDAGLSDMQAQILIDQEINELKSLVYYNLFKNKLKDTRGKFIIEGVRDKTIDTNPRLISIKLFNFFPQKILTRIVEEN
ncbi:MAG: hypothetical protein ACLFN8_00285 [Candidatus Woesearchaeota archaeon]